MTPKSRAEAKARESVTRYNHKDPFVQLEMRKCGELSYVEGYLAGRADCEERVRALVEHWVNAESSSFHETLKSLREATVNRCQGEPAFWKPMCLIEKSAYDDVVRERDNWKRNADARWDGLVSYEKEFVNRARKLLEKIDGTHDNDDE